MRGKGFASWRRNQLRIFEEWQRSVWTIINAGKMIAQPWVHWQKSTRTDCSNMSACCSNRTIRFTVDRQHTSESCYKMEEKAGKVDQLCGGVSFVGALRGATGRR